MREAKRERACTSAAAAAACEAWASACLLVEGPDGDHVIGQSKQLHGCRLEHCQGCCGRLGQVQAVGLAGVRRLDPQPHVGVTVGVGRSAGGPEEARAETSAELAGRESVVSPQAEHTKPLTACVQTRSRQNAGPHERLLWRQDLWRRSHRRAGWRGQRHAPSDLHGQEEGGGSGGHHAGGWRWAAQSPPHCGALPPSSAWTAIGGVGSAQLASRAAGRGPAGPTGGGGPVAATPLGLAVLQLHMLNACACLSACRACA